MTETVSITIRGVTHSRELPTEAVDLMLAAFRSDYREQLWPRDEAGEFVEMTDGEFYALCIRTHSIAIARGYAAKLDAAITPNSDAVATMVAGIET